MKLQELVLLGFILAMACLMYFGMAEMILLRA